MLQDFVNAAWIATLHPVALASWSVPRFTVSVITNDRPWSLKRLLTSLRTSVLFGVPVDVAFSVEASADDETLALVQVCSTTATSIIHQCIRLLMLLSPPLL
jgi:hypothetical protein